jgi:hypothetical protein
MFGLNRQNFLYRLDRQDLLLRIDIHTYCWDRGWYTYYYCWNGMEHLQYCWDSTGNRYCIAEMVGQAVRHPLSFAGTRQTTPTVLLKLDRQHIPDMVR